MTNQPQTGERVCPECGGTGYGENAIKSCPRCKGRGTEPVHMQTQTADDDRGGRPPQDQSGRGTVAEGESDE